MQTKEQKVARILTDYINGQSMFDFNEMLYAVLGGDEDRLYRKHFDAINEVEQATLQLLCERFDVAEPE